MINLVMRINLFLSALMAGGLLALSSISSAAVKEPVPTVVWHPALATGAEHLAACEIQRYAYARTGHLLAVAPSDKPPRKGASGVVVAGQGTALGRATVAGLKLTPPALQPEEYWIKTVSAGRGRVTVVLGGDAQGALFGAYRLAEHLGVRFYLHGDVVPDGRVALDFTGFEETGRPLFATRGINPFHDFSEGPDWWNQDDYLAYIHQLAKMRMNFLGLHCYPANSAGPECAVWIGQTNDMDAAGRVTFSYPSHWSNTRRDKLWGNAAAKTSDYSAGAAMLFPEDDYGPEVMAGFLPNPVGSNDCNALFNRAAGMFGTAFAQARALGVKTCLGTETPLFIPPQVQERLKAQGRDPNDPAVVRDIYQGMFQRIARACPVDYYWLWTPEGWTWSGNKPEEYERTAQDMRLALEALGALGHPFTLATCGWVLGPQQDRAAFDNALPKNVPIACISRQLGHEPIDPGFAKIRGRPSWAIPWMENDPNMIGPQPWVGRMRADAVDARKLGCTGLLGIHWRTKAMAANVSALAQAAWDQSWVPAATNAPAAPPKEKIGALGGNLAQTQAAIQDAALPAVYQTVRYNLEGYRLEIPNGTYQVTLQFCEIHYNEAGKRVFGVSLQGKTVIPSLDVLAAVGKNKACDHTFASVSVTNGRLALDFNRITELPCISGIVIAGRTADANQIAGGPYARKINCGGGAAGDYEADSQAEGTDSAAQRGRTMPVLDFYTDFARASFGDAVAAEAGRILAAQDGVQLPEVSAWMEGPGGLGPDGEPWEKVRARYAFVEDLAALHSRIRTAGARERLDYWVRTYRALAAMAEARCRRGELDVLMARLDNTNAPADAGLADQALAKRLELTRAWDKLMTWHVATVDTPGEMGTIDNLERHTRRTLQFLSAHDAALEKMRGKPLPPEAQPSARYAGPTRMTVPTVRTLASPGEKLTIPVLILAAGEKRGGVLCWRMAGQGKFQQVPLQHRGRAVYAATLPVPAQAGLLEYYVQAEADGHTLRWPASASAPCQTVVVARLP